MRNFLRISSFTLFNLCFATSIIAGQTFSNPSAVTQSQSHVRKANKDLDSAIQYAKEILAKKLALFKLMAEVMKQPFDTGTMDDIEDSEFKNLFSKFSKLDFMDAMAKELAPALAELYVTYPAEVIIQKMNQTVAHQRLEIEKLQSAKYFGEKFLKTNDQDNLEKSNLLLESLKNDSTPSAIRPIAIKFVEILKSQEESKKDSNDERFDELTKALRKSISEIEET
jgi:hypothetical protein